MTAERDGRFWFLRVPELPGVFSQVRRLDQAEERIRDAIALWLDVPEDSFDVDVQPTPRPDLQRLVASTLRLRHQADHLLVGSNTVTGAAVRFLLDRGLTVRDVGTLLGLSYQRVAQVAASAAPPKWKADELDPTFLATSGQILADIERARVPAGTNA